MVDLPQIKTFGSSMKSLLLACALFTTSLYAETLPVTKRVLTQDVSGRLSYASRTLFVSATEDNANTICINNGYDRALKMEIATLRDVVQVYETYRASFTEKIYLGTQASGNTLTTSEDSKKILLTVSCEKNL